MNGKCLQGYFSSAQNYNRQFKTYLIFYAAESIGSKTRADTLMEQSAGGNPSAALQPRGAQGAGALPSVLPLQIREEPGLLHDGRFGMDLLFPSELV